ncbi:MAG: GntR family transcriptional regulator [Bacteroidota bacterium]
MYQFKLNTNNGHRTKLNQVVHTIIMDIEKGVLKKDQQLPSVTGFSKAHSVSRDTIEKAYKELKKQGYITSVASKGYYVLGKKGTKLKVLLVFNKLSSYKKIIYDNLVAELSKKVKVDLHIHHYSIPLFKEIMDESLGKYQYYVIMPHFVSDAKRSDYMKIIRKIPPDELMLLDKNLPELGNRHMSVFQDFKQDVYDSLVSATDLLKKYDRLTTILPQYHNHPAEILDGVAQYGKDHKMKTAVCVNADKVVLTPGTAFVVTSETDLAKLIKKIRKTTLKIGKDIGIVSYNETALKDLLDITTVTTDFAGMGKSAAKLILEKQHVQVKNPFRMIRRTSL